MKKTKRMDTDTGSLESRRVYLQKILTRLRSELSKKAAHAKPTSISIKIIDAYVIVRDFFEKTGDAHCNIELISAEDSTKSEVIAMTVTKKSFLGGSCGEYDVIVDRSGVIRGLKLVQSRQA